MGLNVVYVIAVVFLACAHAACRGERSSTTCGLASACRDGYTVPGLCPGGNDVVCCIHSSDSGCLAKGGTCLTSSSCSAKGGSTISNLCKGASSNIKCCVSGSSGGGTTVADAIKAAGCSTEVLAKLSRQLVNATNCLNTRGGDSGFASIDLSGVTLTSAARAVPFLQIAAANSLQSVLKGSHPSGNLPINSALRTLPQQLMLYKWYLARKCGIPLAAKPGSSNHQSGIALDVGSPQRDTWKVALESKGWAKLGAKDPPHYTYVGSGSADLRKISITAFQKLYNLNNPSTPIGEDGLYGSGTEKAMLSAPISGWPKNLC